MAIEKKKSKFLGPFWNYKLDSSANQANLSQKWARLAELAVLFSWWLQNSPQDSNFFNRQGDILLMIMYSRLWNKHRTTFIEF